jgi:phosphate:Na+ symporter
MILGATVGSTLTVQIFAFNVSQFGLPIFALSFFAYFLTKKRILKSAAGAFMGFGLLFLGLEFIQVGTSELGNIEHFQELVSWRNTCPSDIRVTMSPTSTPFTT